MKIIDPGHRYALAQLDGSDLAEGELVFVKRFRGEDNHPGTTNQEVLRVLIDRVEALHRERPWKGNRKILKHLRKALVLHECRALQRKVEKDELRPERVEIDRNDGHFKLILETER